MHPGQYTVLNSPREEVSKRAVEDLNYHVRLLNSLGTDASHKIVLHIGGAYQHKWQAMQRFISRFRNLDESVKQRLVIENDEKLFNIEDVLEVGSKLGVPVVFDNLHHELNPCTLQKSITEWIEACAKTWRKQDGRQKIHYSQQDFQKKNGSHSNTIRIDQFIAFYKCLHNADLDIMLEVKDKNLSAIKCLNCLYPTKHIKALETEWSRYKYNVLERSPDDYLEIRELLKNKMEYPAIAFYRMLENALQRPCGIGNFLNAAQHVWGYFKDLATDTEKESFHRRACDFQKGKAKATTIKSFLRRMAVKYHEDYLLNSYYFAV
jgi:UV DNA damage endonuclease